MSRTALCLTFKLIVILSTIVIYIFQSGCSGIAVGEQSGAVVDVADKGTLILSTYHSLDEEILKGSF